MRHAWHLFLLAPALQDTIDTLSELVFLLDGHSSHANRSCRDVRPSSLLASLDGRVSAVTPTIVRSGRQLEIFSYIRRERDSLGFILFKLCICGLWSLLARKGHLSAYPISDSLHIRTFQM